MKLWSLHTPGFSLTRGRVDHARSEYWRECRTVRKAYPKLWELIGVPDGQVIWYFTAQTGILRTGVKKILWELNVPDSEIIAFVDSIVWNRVLERQCALPRDLRARWLGEANDEFPGDSAKRDAYLREQEEQFWLRKPPSGDWWDSLLTERRSHEAVSAITRHPACEGWISDSRDWVSR